MLAPMHDLPLIEKAPAARRIRLDTAGGSVTLHIEDAVLVIELAGAARLGTLRRALEEGRRIGWLGQAAMPTLVDLSQFSGNVDWSELKAISTMADWPLPGGRQVPVAYVSEDTLFLMLVKAAQAFFPWALHRVFSRRDWAMEWLHGQPACPESAETAK
jgi:hypothetical protein